MLLPAVSGTGLVSVYAITPLTDGAQGVMPLFLFPILFNSLFATTVVNSLLILQVSIYTKK